MKRIITTIIAIAASAQAFCCTNLIVTRGASTDGSNIVTYAADSHTRYGFLNHLPAAKHKPGTLRAIYEYGPHRFLGHIPEAARTFNVVGNINEHQLIIGESTWGGLETHIDPKGVLDYGSLMYIALQRCTTAREAIELMVALANEYGYASSGESISIADKDEAWILEMISKAPRYDEAGANINKGVVWVAVRIPDGYISAHANAARIARFPLDDPANCLYAPDLFEYLRAEGLYDGDPAAFSFADTFCPLDYGTLRGCEARVWAFFHKYGAEDMSQYLDFARGDNPSNRMPLYVKPAAKLSVLDVAAMMRDHYEGTEFDMTLDPGAGGHSLPYRWRPMGFEVDGVQYLQERAIATQQTGFWFVAQARKHLPDPVGGVIWFAVDDAATSPLTPYYCSATEISRHYAFGHGNMVQYSDESMFWLTNRVAQFAYLRYNQIGAEVQEVIAAHEAQMLRELAHTDSLACSLLGVPPPSSRDLTPPSSPDFTSPSSRDLIAGSHPSDLPPPSSPGLTHPSSRDLIAGSHPTDLPPSSSPDLTPPSSPGLTPPSSPGLTPPSSPDLIAGSHPSDLPPSSSRDLIAGSHPTPKKVTKLLTRFSVESADALFAKWKALDQYLLVKYIDGNTKKQNPDGTFTTNGHCDWVPVTPNFPGYDRSFLETIARSPQGQNLRSK